MSELLSIDPNILLAAWLVTFVAAFVKGAIGFAMPTILVSGFTIFMPAETAIAVMIVPSLWSNLQQALHCGVKNARALTRPFRGFIVLVLVLIVIFAQIFAHLEGDILYILIGLPISLFSLVLLLGSKIPFLNRKNPLSGYFTALISGFGGGIAGIWGPPIVLYLNALKVRKKTQYGLQGVIYGLCALVFFLAHIASGVMGKEEFILSCLMIPIAFIGMKIGVVIQDRLNQENFRRIALFILILSGLNLIRKGVTALFIA